MTTRTKEKSAIAKAALAGNQGFSLISNEKLLQLYALMLKCRMIEGKSGTLSNCEAAVAGVSIDLESKDSVASSSGNLVASLIKGLRLHRVISCLPARGRAFDGRLAAATTLAREHKKKKNGKVVVVFREGEATAMDSWNQALSVADAEQLPMLFVSFEAGTAAPGYSFPSIPVDGSDVVAVYRVATEAMAHARKGNGATLIASGGWPSNDPAETDPISKMEAYLSSKGICTAEVKRAVETGFGKKLRPATLRARISRRSSRSALSPVHS